MSSDDTTNGNTDAGRVADNDPDADNVSSGEYMIIQTLMRIYDVQLMMLAAMQGADIVPKVQHMHSQNKYYFPPFEE